MWFARLVICTLLSIPAIGFCQTNTTRRPAKTADTSPQALAYSLTNGLTSSRQKVEVIFRWITDNIDYKVNPSLYFNKYSYTPEEDTGALKPVSERVAEQVLRNRVAFCDGYARLFTTLCNYAGIRSEVITGYANPDGSASGKFRSNHSWNAVLIDSAWYLVDVTWASGYVTYGNDRFIRRYDDYYFLTSPQQFIKSHYPEDLQWSLLKDPPAVREFQYGPFKPSGFIRNQIKAFAPSQGILEASVGDTLRFEFQPEDVTHNVHVVDAVDTILLSQVDWWQYPSTPATVDGSLIKVNYVVPSESIQWLHLVYNNSVVLRYRINVKKTMMASK